MKVLRFQEYSNSHDLAYDLINMLSSPSVMESAEEDGNPAWKQILNKVFSDLGLNFILIATFGAGIAAMYPIVSNLVTNGNIKIEATSENILLLTVAAITITFLEEKKNRTTSKNIDISDDEIKKDTKSILEELKLKGIGNGIVKKVVKCFLSIRNIIKLIFEHSGNIIGGFIDMFAYTSFMIPAMNIFNSFIDKYDFNLETLPGNFASIGVGVLSLVAKNGLSFLINKLGDKFKFKKDRILKDLNIPPIKKYPHPDVVDVGSKNLDLIKGNEKN